MSEETTLQKNERVLSLRLSTIASMVSPGNRLVDVGCDHAFLAISLCRSGRIPSAIVSDVRPGPLFRAKEHIREAGLEDVIEARLSDGLTGFAPGEGDSLVIAGMGGPLMERILGAHPEVRDSFSELVLQPQSDIPRFRSRLLEDGFRITDERIVEEDGKFYMMMKACRCSSGDAGCWSPEELVYGKRLLAEENPVMERFLEREERIQNSILGQLEAGGSRAAEERKTEMLENRRLLAAARERYRLAAGKK